MPDTGIGASVRRKEDFRFLTGQGRFTDDIDRPGQVHAYFVRSPHAHARIKRVDTAAAAKAPGVLAVFTGADMAADKVGSLPCGWTVTDRHGVAHKAPPHFPLARDKVRYVGDHRSEEHTSELQSLMRISYAVFCLKKKKQQHTILYTTCKKSTQNQDSLQSNS